MGVADVVPGVSGGTIALLTGIYPRLIRSISRFDRSLVSLVLRGRWRQAVQHVDGVFLVALVSGIGIGFVVAVKTLGRWLLDEPSRSVVLAAFFGMVVAAVLIVAGLVKRAGPSTWSQRWVPGLVAFAVALLISRLTPDPGGGPISLWYFFLCGSLGICAMILPGISGALILVLLGVYERLVETARQLLGLENLASNLSVAAVFGMGAAVGLAVASRLLRWLLEHRPVPTLSVLCGLMIGSLPLLWPWQQAVAAAEEPDRPPYRPVWPESLDHRAAVYAATALLAVLLVLTAERLAHRISLSRESGGDDSSVNSNGPGQD